MATNVEKSVHEYYSGLVQSSNSWEYIQKTDIESPRFAIEGYNYFYRISAIFSSYSTKVKHQTRNDIKVRDIFNKFMEFVSQHITGVSDYCLVFQYSQQYITSIIKGNTGDGEKKICDNIYIAFINFMKDLNRLRQEEYHFIEKIPIILKPIEAFYTTILCQILIVSGYYDGSVKNRYFLWKNIIREHNNKMLNKSYNEIADMDNELFKKFPSEQFTISKNRHLYQPYRPLLTFIGLLKDLVSTKTEKFCTHALKYNSLLTGIANQLFKDNTVYRKTVSALLLIDGKSNLINPLNMDNTDFIDGLQMVTDCTDDGLQIETADSMEESTKRKLQTETDQTILNDCINNALSSDLIRPRKDDLTVYSLGKTIVYELSENPGIDEEIRIKNPQQTYGLGSMTKSVMRMQLLTFNEHVVRDLLKLSNEQAVTVLCKKGQKNIIYFGLYNKTQNKALDGICICINVKDEPDHIIYLKLPVKPKDILSAHDRIKEIYTKNPGSKKTKINLRGEELSMDLSNIDLSADRKETERAVASILTPNRNLNSKELSTDISFDEPINPLLVFNEATTLNTEGMLFEDKGLETEEEKTVPKLIETENIQKTPTASESMEKENTKKTSADPISEPKLTRAKNNPVTQNDPLLEPCKDIVAQAMALSFEVGQKEPEQNAISKEQTVSSDDRNTLSDITKEQKTAPELKEMKNIQKTSVDQTSKSAGPTPTRVGELKPDKNDPKTQGHPVLTTKEQKTVPELKEMKNIQKTSVDQSSKSTGSTPKRVGDLNPDENNPKTRGDPVSENIKAKALLESEASELHEGEEELTEAQEYMLLYPDKCVDAINDWVISTDKPSGISSAPQKCNKRTFPIRSELSKQRQSPFKPTRNVCIQHGRPLKDTDNPQNIPRKSVTKKASTRTGDVSIPKLPKPTRHVCIQHGRPLKDTVNPQNIPRKSVTKKASTRTGDVSIPKLPEPITTTVSKGNVISQETNRNVSNITELSGSQPLTASSNKSVTKDQMDITSEQPMVSTSKLTKSVEMKTNQPKVSSYEIEREKAKAKMDTTVVVSSTETNSETSKKTSDTAEKMDIKEHRVLSSEIEARISDKISKVKNQLCKAINIADKPPLEESSNTKTSSQDVIIIKSNITELSGSQPLTASSNKSVRKNNTKSPLPEYNIQSPTQQTVIDKIVCSGSNRTSKLLSQPNDTDRSNRSVYARESDSGENNLRNENTSPAPPSGSNASPSRSSNDKSGHIEARKRVLHSSDSYDTVISSSSSSSDDDSGSRKRPLHSIKGKRHKPRRRSMSSDASDTEDRRVRRLSVRYFTNILHLKTTHGGNITSYFIKEGPSRDCVMEHLAMLLQHDFHSPYSMTHLTINDKLVNRVLPGDSFQDSEKTRNLKGIILTRFKREKQKYKSDDDTEIIAEKLRAVLESNYFDIKKIEELLLVYSVTDYVHYETNVQVMSSYNTLIHNYYQNMMSFKQFSLGVEEINAMLPNDIQNIKINLKNKVFNVDPIDSYDRKGMELVNSYTNTLQKTIDQFYNKNVASNYFTEEYYIMERKRIISTDQYFNELTKHTTEFITDYKFQREKETISWVNTQIKEFVYKSDKLCYTDVVCKLNKLHSAIDNFDGLYILRKAVEENKGLDIVKQNIETFFIDVYKRTSKQMEESLVLTDYRYDSGYGIVYALIHLNDEPFYKYMNDIWSAEDIHKSMIEHLFVCQNASLFKKNKIMIFFIEKLERCIKQVDNILERQKEEMLLLKKEEDKREVFSIMEGIRSQLLSLEGNMDNYDASIDQLRGFQSRLFILQVNHEDNREIEYLLQDIGNKITAITRIKNEADIKSEERKREREHFNHVITQIKCGGAVDQKSIQILHKINQFSNRCEIVGITENIKSQIEKTVLQYLLNNNIGTSTVTNGKVKIKLLPPLHTTQERMTGLNKALAAIPNEHKYGCELFEMFKNQRELFMDTLISETMKYTTLNIDKLHSIKHTTITEFNENVTKRKLKEQEDINISMAQENIDVITEFSQLSIAYNKLDNNTKEAVHQQYENKRNELILQEASTFDKAVEQVINIVLKQNVFSNIPQDSMRIIQNITKENSLYDIQERITNKLINIPLWEKYHIENCSRDLKYRLIEETTVTKERIEMEYSQLLQNKFVLEEIGSYLCKSRQRVARLPKKFGEILTCKLDDTVSLILNQLSHYETPHLSDALQNIFHGIKERRSILIADIMQLFNGDRIHKDFEFTGELKTYFEFIERETKKCSALQDLQQAIDKRWEDMKQLNEQHAEKIQRISLSDDSECKKRLQKFKAGEIETYMQDLKNSYESSALKIKHDIDAIIDTITNSKNLSNMKPKIKRQFQFQFDSEIKKFNSSFSICNSTLLNEMKNLEIMVKETSTKRKEQFITQSIEDYKSSYETVLSACLPKLKLFKNEYTSNIIKYRKNITDNISIKDFDSIEDNDITESRDKLRTLMSKNCTDLLNDFPKDKYGLSDVLEYNICATLIPKTIDHWYANDGGIGLYKSTEIKNLFDSISNIVDLIVKLIAYYENANNTTNYISRETASSVLDLCDSRIKKTFLYKTLSNMLKITDKKWAVPDRDYITATLDNSLKTCSKYIGDASFTLAHKTGISSLLFIRGGVSSVLHLKDAGRLSSTNDQVTDNLNRLLSTLDTHGIQCINQSLKHITDHLNKDRMKVFSFKEQYTQLVGYSDYTKELDEVILNALFPSGSESINFNLPEIFNKNKNLLQTLVTKHKEISAITSDHKNRYITTETDLYVDSGRITVDKAYELRESVIHSYKQLLTDHELLDAYCDNALLCSIRSLYRSGLGKELEKSTLTESQIMPRTYNIQCANGKPFEKVSNTCVIFDLLTYNLRAKHMTNIDAIGTMPKHYKQDLFISLKPVINNIQMNVFLNPNRDRLNILDYFADQHDINSLNIHQLKKMHKFLKVLMNFRTSMALMNTKFSIQRAIFSHSCILDRNIGNIPVEKIRVFGARQPLEQMKEMCKIAALVCPKLYDSTSHFFSKKSSSDPNLLTDDRLLNDDVFLMSITAWITYIYTCFKRINNLRHYRGQQKASAWGSIMGGDFKPLINLMDINLFTTKPFSNSTEEPITDPFTMFVLSIYQYTGQDINLTINLIFSRSGLRCIRLPERPTANNIKVFQIIGDILRLWIGYVINVMIHDNIGGLELLWRNYGDDGKPLNRHINLMYRDASFFDGWVFTKDNDTLNSVLNILREINARRHKIYCMFDFVMCSVVTGLPISVLETEGDYWREIINTTSLKKNIMIFNVTYSVKDFNTLVTQGDIDNQLLKALLSIDGSIFDCVYTLTNNNTRENEMTKKIYNTESAALPLIGIDRNTGRNKMELRVISYMQQHSLQSLGQYEGSKRDFVYSFEYPTVFETKDVILTNNEVNKINRSMGLHPIQGPVTLPLLLHKLLGDFYKRRPIADQQVIRDRQSNATTPVTRDQDTVFRHPAETRRENITTQQRFRSPPPPQPQPTYPPRAQMSANQQMQQQYQRQQTEMFDFCEQQQRQERQECLNPTSSSSPQPFVDQTGGNRRDFKTVAGERKTHKKKKGHKKGKSVTFQDDIPTMGHITDQLDQITLATKEQIRLKTAQYKQEH